MATRTGPRPPQYRRRSTTPRARLIILFENSQATAFKPETVTKFVAELEAKGFAVKRVAPTSAHDMTISASDARTARPWALVAAGGDGAVNLVARTLVGSPIRLGILPLGKCNNIFRSLVGEPSPAAALKVISEGGARMIDCGKVAGQPFFGSIALGLLPQMAEELKGRALPKLGLGWSHLASRASASVRRERTGIKIDSMKFEASPLTLSVNLLPYSVSLQLAPSAILDDQRFEITIDNETSSEPLSKFIRAVFKKKYIYHDEIRVFRGQEISLGPVKGRTLYLDGELITIPTNTIDVTFYPTRLRAFAHGASKED